MFGKPTAEAKPDLKKATAHADTGYVRTFFKRAASSAVGLLRTCLQTSDLIAEVKKFKTSIELRSLVVALGAAFVSGFERVAAQSPQTKADAKLQTVHQIFEKFTTQIDGINIEKLFEEELKKQLKQLEEDHAALAKREVTEDTFSDATYSDTVYSGVTNISSLFEEEEGAGKGAEQAPDEEEQTVVGDILHFANDQYYAEYQRTANKALLAVVERINLGDPLYQIPGSDLFKALADAIKPEISTANSTLLVALDKVGATTGEAACRLANHYFTTLTPTKSTIASSMMSGFLEYLSFIKDVESLQYEYGLLSSWSFGANMILGAVTGMYEELAATFPGVLPQVKPTEPEQEEPLDQKRGFFARRFAIFRNNIAADCKKAFEPAKETYAPLRSIFSTLDEEKRKKLIDEFVGEGACREYRRTILAFLSRYCSKPAAGTAIVLEYATTARNLVKNAAFDTPRDVARMAVGAVQTVAGIARSIIGSIGAVFSRKDTMDKDDDKNYTDTAIRSG